MMVLLKSNTSNTAAGFLPLRISNQQVPILHNEMDQQFRQLKNDMEVREIILVIAQC